MYETGSVTAQHILTRHLLKVVLQFLLRVRIFCSQSVSLSAERKISSTTGTRTQILRSSSQYFSQNIYRKLFYFKGKH